MQAMKERDDTRLNWVNTLRGKIKNALHGTYHALGR